MSRCLLRAWIPALVFGVAVTSGALAQGQTQSPPQAQVQSQGQVPKPAAKKPATTSADSTSQSLPRLDDLIQVNTLLANKQYAAAGRALGVVFGQGRWPAPLQALVRDHALALAHLAPEVPLPDPTLDGTPAERKKAAESLGLIPVDKSSAGAGAQKSPPPALPGDPAKPTLAQLKTAWSLGLSAEAQRIASKARLVPHGKSCNGYWAYSQWVLGRLARSAQNRKESFGYQRLLADHLLKTGCTPAHFEMSPEEFGNFRRSELLWAARFAWEFEELQTGEKLATVVLEDAIRAKSSEGVLEALQVLYGRIRYELEIPKDNLEDLDKLRNRLTDAGLMSPALTQTIGLRRALLAFEVRDYRQCVTELEGTTSAVRSGAGASGANVVTGANLESPALRRDYTQHLYWMARCAALSGLPNASELVKSAWDEIHRYGATGYYAMLIQQDFPGYLAGVATSAGDDFEFSVSDAITLGVFPENLQDLKVLNAQFEKSQKIREIPRSSPLWQLPAAWVAATVKGKERALFDQDRNLMTTSWDFLLSAERSSDVVLSAGRLSQNFRLDHPQAQLIRKYLYPRVYQEAFAEAAEKCAVDPVVVYSVARQESLFNPKAVSPAGARGLVQLMPSVWGQLRKEWKEWDLSDDPFDPRSNVILGACHLRDALALFRGNLALGLAGYNAGTTAADSWFRRRFRGDMPLFVESIPFAETQDYVKQITRSVFHVPKIWSQPTSLSRAK